MNIQEIERELGIPRANIRYYEKEGLLHPQRGSNNYRIYSDEDVETLKKIRLLRSLDMPVETIRAVQAGEVPLAEALARQARLLDNEAAKLERAQTTCRAMLDDRVTYTALEPARYEGSAPALPGQAVPPPEKPKRPPVEGAQWAFDPWQRFWARDLDFALASAVVWAVLTLGFRMSVTGTPRWLLQTLNIVLSWGIWLILEPLLLCTWGTTPGKWLLGLELRNKEGRKLGFLQGLRRTWDVLVVGYGLEIPILCWYCMYKGYRECRDNRPMHYDYEAENLYYSRAPDRWGWRAAVSVALSLALLPVHVWCGFQVLRPPNRGEVTPAEFAENVSAVAKALDYSLWVDEEGYRLSEQTAQYLIDGEGEGDWEERRYGERYEEEPVYTLEVDGDGFVTGVRMEQAGSSSVEEDSWVFLPTGDAQIILAAFRGAWCGGYDMLRGPIMEALGQSPHEWTGQPVEEGGFTLTLTLEQEGYEGFSSVGGSTVLVAEKEAEEHFYHFLLKVDKM